MEILPLVIFIMTIGKCNFSLLGILIDEYEHLKVVLLIVCSARTFNGIFGVFYITTPLGKLSKKL